MLPLGILLAKSVSDRNLAIGIFGIAIFAVPEALFQFFYGRYYPLAIPLFALLLWQWRSERRFAASSFANQFRT